MGNYATMARRIRKARTRKDYLACERSIARLYHAGIFSVSELGRLAVLIMEQQARRLG